MSGSVVVSKMDKQFAGSASSLSRRRFTRSAAMAAVAAVSASAMTLTGCGSGGRTIDLASHVPSPVSSPVASPFAGVYRGEFTAVTSDVEAGTFDCTVDSFGNFTGTSYNISLNQNADVTGTIDASGSLNATFTYPGGTNTAKGTVAFTSSRALKGTLTEYQQGTPVTQIALTLNLQE